MQISTQIKNIALLIIAIILLVGVSFRYLPKSVSQTKNLTVLSPTQTQSTTITYKGVVGKDALTLLRAQMPVVLDASGMVASINNIKADNNKHQYWEFFVNGKSSNVGAAQYMTKTGDTLMWKIATY